MSGGAFRSDYQYSPGDCDVRSRTALEAFRAKRDEWLQWLHHDKYHAISRQISGVLWSDAVFRLINESRKHAHQAGGEYATQSGIIARSLDRGYVAEQVISFRRLMEKASRDPKKQVISLRRLIDDVRENRHLLTREMFVACRSMIEEARTTCLRRMSTAFHSPGWTRRALALSAWQA